MVDLGTARGRIIIDSSGVTRGVNQASRSITALGKGLLATTGLMAGGIGLAAGLRSVVTTAMDFEQQMSRLQAVSEGTGRQFAALREQAITMGAQTAYSATEAAVAQTELAKAGVGLDDILNGGLQGSLALAAAGELDLGQAASIAANAMKQFGLSGRDVTGIADALATAANQTTADVGDFGLALAQTSAAAKQSGLGFKDTMAALEALADQGVKGSDAGTSLKAALLSLIAPTDKAAEVMKKQGLAITDSNGRMVNSVELSARLTKATEGMTRAQRTQFLATIAGRDGFRALAALIDAGPAGMRRYIRGLSEVGTSAETARKKQNNLRGDLEQLSGSFETLQIKVGSRLTSGLRNVVQEVTSLVGVLGESRQLDGFFDGLTTGASSVQGVLPQVGATIHQVAGAAATLAQAGIGVVGLLGPMAAGFAGLASAAASTAGGLAGFAASVLESSGGQAALTVALYGGVAAWTAYKVAALGAAAASRAVTLAQLAADAYRIVATSTSAAMALQRLSLAFGFLASPAGLAIAGIGAFVGIVAALKSGMFSGGSAAESYANAMERVRSSTDAASGAIQRANDVINGFRRSKLDAVQATLAVERAERAYNDAVRQHGRGSLEAREALANLNQAKQRSAETNQAASRASKTYAADLAKEGQALIEQRDAIEAALKAKGQEIAQMKHLRSWSEEGRREIARAQAEYNRLAEAVRGNGRAIDEYRTRLRKAAAQMDASTPAARQTKKALEALANADADGLRKFVADVKAGTDAGKSQAQATSDAIKNYLKDAGQAQADMSGFVASIRAGGAAAIAAAASIAAQVRAALKAAGPNVRKSPSANDLMRTGLEDQRGIIKQGMEASAREAARGAGNIRRAFRLTDFLRDVRSARVPTLAQLVTGSVKDADRRIEAATRQARGAADEVLAVRRALEAELTRLQKQEDDRRARVQLQGLKAAREAARRELSRASQDVTKAKKPEDRKDAREREAEARRAFIQSGRDIADFLRDTMEATRDARIQAAISTQDRLQQERDELERRRQDLQDTIRDGRATIESGLQQVSSAIVDSLQRALQAQFKEFQAQFDQAIRDAEAQRRRVIQEIDASDDARRLDVVDQEIAAARRLKDAREARSSEKERLNLVDQERAKATQVENLQAVLARARTASERQAAQQLLDQAKKDLADASDQLAAFTEDRELQRLEAERQVLDQGLQQRRQAADQALTDARQAAQDMLEQQRQAAQDASDIQVAQVQRGLNDLREQYAAGELDAATFLQRLQGIYSAFAPQLEASGRELGLSFSRGLERSMADVQGAAWRVAQTVSDLLELHSPAREGPLRFDFTRSGAAIARDMAAGMASGVTLVRQEATRIAAAAAAAAAGTGVLLDALSTPIAAPAAGGVTNINVDARGQGVTPRQMAEQLGWHLAHARGAA